MTKTELLAILESRVLVMKDPVLAQTIDLTTGYTSAYEELRYYTVRAIVDNRPDCITDNTYSFWVFDEGLPTETAKWPVSEHLAPRETTPERLLKEFLDGYVGTNVKSYIIRAGSLNPDTRTALVDVLWSDDSWRLYLVKHTGVDFELELITTA